MNSKSVMGIASVEGEGVGPQSVRSEADTNRRCGLTPSLAPCLLSPQHLDNLLISPSLTPNLRTNPFSFLSN